MAVNNYSDLIALVESQETQAALSKAQSLDQFATILKRLLGKDRLSNVSHIDTINLLYHFLDLVKQPFDSNFDRPCPYDQQAAAFLYILDSLALKHQRLAALVACIPILPHTFFTRHLAQQMAKEL